MKEFLQFLKHKFKRTKL